MASSANAIARTSATRSCTSPLTTTRSSASAVARRSASSPGVSRRPSRRAAPSVRLIADISGESADLAGPYTLTLLEQEANPLVAALGLGGPEVGIPRSLFTPFFDRARRAGYATVAHAGETGGPEHVRQAVLELGARRVQHGVRAAEDPAVMAMLAERHICCDIALTSNEQLKVYPELRRHPLRAFLAAGVPVTLSTDDPPFFGTDLLREWRRAQEELGLSAEEVWELNLNGLRYGLAETAVRRRLLLQFEEAAAGVFPARSA